MIVYIVTAYRWGNRKDHSYVVGAFDKKDAAKKCADSHRDYRGGKYSCDVDMCTIGSFDNNAQDYTEVIYTAKSVNR